MKKETFGVLTALFSALLATTCCLPPLLFLLFGVSFGMLGFLEHLAPFRLPLSFLSLFILYLSWRAYAKGNAQCSMQTRKRYVLGYGVVFMLIVVILLYPECATLFLEGHE